MIGITINASTFLVVGGFVLAIQTVTILAARASVLFVQRRFTEPSKPQWVEVPKHERQGLTSSAAVDVSHLPKIPEQKRPARIGRPPGSTKANITSVLESQEPLSLESEKIKHYS